MYEKLTILCDIDGTLIEHCPPSITSKSTHIPKILDGTLDKLLEWEKKGYVIILTTARKECMRSITERQLAELGVFYDQLIMGLGSGRRILINDAKPNGLETAECINLKRNEGIKNINL